MKFKYNILFKQKIFSILILASILLFQACNNSSKVEPEITTLVMTTELIKDSAVYALYDSLHSKDGVWPALKKANIASGIDEIKIYRFDNRIVMLFSFPANADQVKMDSLYLAADVKVQEWNSLMSSLQRSLPGVDTTQKWVPMKLIHHYSNGEYLK